MSDSNGNDETTNPFEAFATLLGKEADPAETAGALRVNEEFGAEAAIEYIDERAAEREAITKEPPPLKPFRLASTWPKPLGLAAYRGVAGQIVKLIEPQTESDPSAVLIQLLVTLGNIIGRTAYFPVEADRHHTNLFAVIVGKSAKARKGSGWGHVRYTLRAVAPDHPGTLAGLGSGEAVIYAVRDDVEKTVLVKDDKGRTLGRETVVQDCGVLDKRLLIVEDEFAQILRTGAREGSTISIVIRRGWDTGDLRNAVKNSPLKTTGAHISIIGHITFDELKACLSTTDTMNGFGNRFLWVCSQRSKELPEGGTLPDLEEPIRRLKPLIETIRGVGEIPIRRDSEASGYWRERYHDLTRERPGLFGAMTSRAEAQVMRLALVYAVLDGAVAISRDHLVAAFEVWRYVEDSVLHMFGSGTGNRLADTLLEILRANPAGLSKTALRNATKRNHSEDEMKAALFTLQELDMAEGHEDPGAKKGRPAQIWTARGVKHLTARA